MKSLLLLVSLLLVSSSLMADDDDARLVAKAFDILVGESLVVGKYRTGFSDPKPTELAWAFSVIVRKSPDPVRTLSELAKTGSYYALIGLAVLDNSQFQCSLECFSGSPTVCVMIGDTFEEVGAEEFVTNDLVKSARWLFDSLMFETLPDWQDTVRIVSPCKLSEQSNRNDGRR